MRFLVEIQRFQKRHAKASGVKLALEALVCLCLVGTVWAIVNLWYPLGTVWFGTGLILALGWSFLRWRSGRRSLQAVACDVDAECRLDERIATATELAQSGAEGGLTDWQIADAQRMLIPISPSQVYPIRWRKWLWAPLVSGALFAALLHVPHQYEEPVLLTEHQRMLLDGLEESVTATEMGADAASSAEALADAVTLEQAQQGLAQLRSAAEGHDSDVTAELVSQIEALDVPEAFRQQLLAAVEQAGYLPPDTMDAVFEGLRVPIPQGMADQIMKQFQTLDNQRRSLQALMAGIREAQHELASTEQILTQQDGEASQVSGTLGSSTSEIQGAPNLERTLLLEYPADVANSLTGRSGNAESATEPDSPTVRSTEEVVLASQEAFAEAILKERIPTRYVEPIQAYLREVARLVSEIP